MTVFLTIVKNPHRSSKPMWYFEMISCLSLTSQEVEEVGIITSSTVRKSLRGVRSMVKVTLSVVGRQRPCVLMTTQHSALEQTHTHDKAESTDSWQSATSGAGPDSHSKYATPPLA